MKDRKGMLLVLHSPLYQRDGRLFLDDQAGNGLEQWADHFGSIVIAAPLLPDRLASQQRVTFWRDISTLKQPERFEFVPLPWAYSLPQFLQTYPSTCKLLATLIQRCDYLQFAIGGLIGDWAGIAALEARKQRRNYAIHADRVEHQVVKQLAHAGSLKKQMIGRVRSSLMARFEKYVIQSSTLGLWHGQDCYEAYQSLCSNSYIVHDVHTKPEDAITPKALAEKVRSAETNSVLRICYAGRINPMKAPLDWVRAIGAARDAGVNVQATWFGEGELIDEMKSLIAELKLEQCIKLYGLERDRQKLLQQIRESHLMLFTHITPESPRCLIEALISGTPIVGYDSSYVQELTQSHGGGVFVPIHDWHKLGEQIVALDRDREKLAQLIQQAGINGSRFNDKAVFAERSELIKKHLGYPEAEAEVGEQLVMVS